MFLAVVVLLFNAVDTVKTGLNKSFGALLVDCFTALSLLVPLFDDDFVIFDMMDCGGLIAVIG